MEQHLPLKQQVSYNELYNSFDKKIHIYDKIILENSSLIQVCKYKPDFTNFDDKVIFSIDGYLSGFIICSIEDMNKENTSIYTESMNILLGIFLTNLGKESGTLNTLTPPKVISINHTFFKSLEERQFDINLKVHYKSFSTEASTNCDIYILANHSKAKKV